MPAGRPTDYTFAIAQEICDRILDGNTLKQIEALPNMPCARSILRWLDKHEEFSRLYARAHELRADVMAHEILEIGDESGNDWIERDGVLVADHEQVQRSKLRCDNRKWLMSKMLPKKYGDRLTTEHTGADGAPLVPTLNVILTTDAKRDGRD
jgi:hypothetical protein